MTKLIQMEWKKLNQKTVWMELLIYMLILIFFPAFFIKVAMPAFGQSYAAAIELNGFIQMGYVLFGGSLINHVFIEEYKNKTISLSFGYPISRQKLFTAKVLFIALFVFFATIITFILSGLTTYLLDQFFPIINGKPTTSDMLEFFSSMMIGSVLITLISFIPLFYFGIWKRAVVPAIICSIFIMQLPNFSLFFNVKPDVVVIILSILGAISIFLSIKTAESVGEI
ncbi:ABC transporter permease [Bacillus sp. FJAT-49705]|uniref:ABC transporter permease n=1 Tax=Cytobacillus citreus TaxID=2833586 RepID=A0ABS5NWG4_9BACI|nr:ABC transporter permease [Cytobacillus citreus]MBS4192162.1 ABC transporter permease [Cytobacillus citreus]